MLLESAERRHLLRTSFAEIEARRSIAGLLFFRRLFQLAPGLRPLFRDRIEIQAEALLTELSRFLDLLDRPRDFEAAVRELGSRHVGYGARAEHYPLVAQAWLDMLAEVLGPRCTAAVKLAWAEWYRQLTRLMLEGAAPGGTGGEDGSSGLQPQPSGVRA